LGQIHEGKILGRIQIILAPFIYDSKGAIRLGSFVWQHTINLMQFQGRRVSIIVDADGEPNAFCQLRNVPLVPHPVESREKLRGVATTRRSSRGAFEVPAEILVGIGGAVAGAVGRLHGVQGLVD
jgi:hypothetical protein